MTRSSADQLELVEIKPGVRFALATLQDMLPDAETVLFFGKVYELDAQQLGELLHLVLDSDLTSALFAEGGVHSSDLQDYIVDIADVHAIASGDIAFDPDVPKGEILPEVWKSLEVEVATSIKQVASKLQSVVGLMPGKQGSMIFSTMAKVNARRPTIGDFRASIKHDPVKENLVILDVSGSVTDVTVRRIVDDVVAMSYMANAHMAIVSYTCTHWDPGAYDSNAILEAAEFGGTHYETLFDLLSRDWGVIVTIADYDSSLSAKRTLAGATGHADQVLDISLVNKPSFLAECVGQIADEVKPLLIGSTPRVLR